MLLVSSSSQLICLCFFLSHDMMRWAHNACQNHHIVSSKKLRACPHNGDSLGAQLLLSKHFSYIFISTRMCFDSADIPTFSSSLARCVSALLLPCVHIRYMLRPMEHAASTYNEDLRESPAYITRMCCGFVIFAPLKSVCASAMHILLCGLADAGDIFSSVHSTC
jgi:hypothetical protein